MKFPFKKRYLVLGIVALELASIPVAAQVVDKVAFTFEPRVIVAEVPDQPAGQRSFLVATNSGFVIEVDGTVGNVRTNITTTGKIGHLTYGISAQAPGETRGCAYSAGLPTQVYTATRKTADRVGEIEDQAVRVDVAFDPASQPTIRIVPAADSAAARGDSCLMG